MFNDQKRRPVWLEGVNVEGVVGHGARRMQNVRLIGSCRNHYRA